MMSSIWTFACPLGMLAMGGIAWVLTRLPGRRAERLARVASHVSCMPMAASKQPDEADRNAQAPSNEEKIPAHV